MPAEPFNKVYLKVLEKAYFSSFGKTSRYDIAIYDLHEQIEHTTQDGFYPVADLIPGQ